MSIANIRAKIKEALEEIPGLTVSDVVPDTIILPFAFVSLNPANPVTYDFQAHNASYIYHFVVWVIVNKGPSVALAQADIDPYIDPEDGKCIKTVIDKIDFNPDASSKRVLDSPSYGPFLIGSTEYLGVSFNVDVRR